MRTMQTRVTLGTASAAGFGALLVAAASARLDDLPGFVATAGVAALVCGLLVFLVVRRMLADELHALHQLAAAIDGVELDGSPLYRNLPERGPPEVECIVAAWNGFALRFDIMLHSLREQTSQLNERTKQMAASLPCAARRAQQQADGLHNYVRDIETHQSGRARMPSPPIDIDLSLAALTANIADLDQALHRLQDGGEAGRSALRTLEEFAQQANLLAFDAAIEAAQTDAVFSQSATASAHGRDRIEDMRRELERLASAIAAWRSAAAEAADAEALENEAQRNARLIGDKLENEAKTVARRTEEFAATAVEVAAIAANVEASIWPHDEHANDDIVSIGALADGQQSS